MISLSLLTSAAVLGGSTIPNDALTIVLVRGFIAEHAADRFGSIHAGIPAWARRYNVNCSHCHTPAVPRLNATGMRFKWAGFRMPEDIVQSGEVQRIQNYISLRARVRYDYAKTEDQPASTSQFSFNDATLFYGGPFGG